MGFIWDSLAQSFSRRHIILLLLWAFVSPQAGYAETYQMRSPEDQQAVATALDRLMARDEWALAETVARNYLASKAHTAGFYERAIQIYAHNQRYDEARLLSHIALEFYPDYAPFYRYHAQLLARSGQCRRAQQSWAAYRALAYAPIRAQDQEGFDHFCGMKATHKHHMTSSMGREERLSPLFGSDEVIAVPGSLLYQLCSLAIVLCPEDGRFYLERPPPSRTAFSARYHAMSTKRYSWHHQAQIDLEILKQIGGYRKSHIQLAAQYNRRVSLYRLMRLQLRYKEALVPKFGSYSAQITASPAIESQFHYQLSPDWRAEISLSYGASEVRTDTQRATSHQRLAAHRIYWQADSHNAISLTWLDEHISPPHNDEFGRQMRTGYGLEYRYHHEAGFVMRLAFERSKTQFEKILPFLVRPHRIVEKQAFLHLSQPFDAEKRIIPYVYVGQVSRLSDNPRQQGQKTIISAGISFRY